MAQPHLQHGGGFAQQHGTSSERDDSHKEHAPSRTSAVADAETTVAPVADQIFVAATAPTTAAALPRDVHPGQIVSQIAHQAELFHLPGNKGVRIQLHPEDLGGVQVTVRYGAGGGLELHINVEHAATGSLVEAGWTQLRDALATQGISPDRLVMSITSPGGANHLDFSSSGGGTFRSDPGFASFAQGGQSGQQRDQTGGGDGSSAARRWVTGADPVSSSDDLLRAASAQTGAASRIDYRV